eukprot:c11084_g1_i1 orf=105-1715(+)
MGGSSSRSVDPEAAEVKSLESRLSSLGDLPDLRILFSHLSPSSDPIAPYVLQEHFELKVQGASCPSSSQLSILSQNIASTIIDVIFEPSEKGISWRTFLRGVEKTHQMSVSIKLKHILLFFYHLKKKAQLPVNFSFKNDDISDSLQSDLTGHMTSPELQDLLWLCWLMGCNAYTHKKDGPLDLPNVEPLVKSACLGCSDNDLAPDTLLMEKLHKWMLLTVPGLPVCLFDYIQARLHESAAIIQGQIKASSDSDGQHDPEAMMVQASDSLTEHHLFDSSVAWAIGLCLPDALGNKILTCSFSLQRDAASLLYRSSLHGTGMNRFWVHMEGYQGTVLMLVQGVTAHSVDDNTREELGEEKWLVGALVKEGFENKNCYYGSRGCCIFALDPVMQPFHPSGMGSNFVYSHSHVATSTSYLQQQKGPEGIAFGGDIGKERLFLDKDFMHLTVRHHAVDKTYESGHLLPNQGYGIIKGKVLDVEVWGLGGAATREKQAKFQDRKNLFVEQKRKIDLRNWADSPEKMMMNMMSDPNRAQRQER